MRFLPLIVLLAAGHVSADPIHLGLTDRWQFDFSVAAQQPKATLRSTRSGDRETEIDLKDLGADDREATGQIGVRYRINDRWRAIFAYSPLTVSGTDTTTREFNFGGIEYPLTTTLSTDLDLQTYIFAVDYAFHQSDTTEWGVGAGLHAMDLSLEFEGDLNGITIGASEEDFLAPLPNLRLYMKHALNEKWLVGGSIGWLGADIEEYSGDLIVAGAFVDYRINDNWSVGASYQMIDIDLTVDDSPDEQEYDIELPGFALSVSYSIPK